jgi:ABC-type multidrug transport system fused ATPase/permease subunit
MGTIDRSSRRAYYARALRELWGDRKNAAGFLAATAVRAVAHGALAVCAGLIGQALVGRQVAYAVGKIQPLIGTFSPLVLSLFGFAAAIVKAAASAASIYGQKRATFRLGDAVRLEITGRILAAGQARGRAQEAHAALVVRIRDVERGMDEGLLAGVRAAAELVPLAVALVALSTTLALGALAVLLPFALALAWARRRFRAQHARAARLAEGLHAGLDELVRHVDLWRSFGASSRVRSALAKLGERAGIAAARAEAGRGALSGANEALAAAALLVVIALVTRGVLPLGHGPLVAFAAIFFLMYRPLRDLGDARSHLDRGAQALGELEELTAHVGQDVPDREPRERLRGRTVRTEASSFRTPAWPFAALEVCGLRARWMGGRGVGFRVEAGEILTIVGPTGSGKTTLLRALLGLEPAEGSVRYGSEELGEAGVGPQARPFAWVPQEAAIVTGMLAENVVLGRADATGADAEELARKSFAAIGASPLVGRVGESVSAGGPELSGGERQWVAIARALVSELPVLLLDEPTAGLDDAAQARVLEALVSLRGRRTVIVVSHRPEPVVIADHVLRLGAPATASDAAETRATA